MKLAPLSIISDRQDLEKVENRKRTNEITQVVNGLGELLLPGNAVSEPLNADNALWLAQGAQAGFDLQKPRTRLQGGSGAAIANAATFRSTATVIGLDFTASVNLQASSMTTFIGCTFNRSGVPALVLCQSGAKATFTGCTFYGSGLTQVVDNPGVITDIQLLGCANLTGAAAGNVTETGGV